jgi:tRNA 2-selenouridine synthase
LQIPKLHFKDLELHHFDSVIDVRSPSEFAEDHILGSINLPVLSDDERILVGTIYKQESRFKARKIGAALIAKNSAQYLETELFEKERDWRPLIYCWRGGQRSSSFATILSEIGWRPSLVDGGYKNYRNDVTQLLHKTKPPYQFILISGHTGTAKTEIVNILNEFSLQTIDLEGLANHRGSVFGATATKQSSQKLFESRLFTRLQSLDPRKPIILESESNKIGQLAIPSMIWNIMKLSPRIEVNAPLNERAKYLTTTYADLIEDKAQLSQRIEFLTHQHGHKKVCEWKNLAKESKFHALAKELMFVHYDSRYQNSQQRHPSKTLLTLELNQITKENILKAAKKIKDLANSFTG